MGLSSCVYLCLLGLKLCTSEFKSSDLWFVHHAVVSLNLDCVFLSSVVCTVVLYAATLLEFLMNLDESVDLNFKLTGLYRAFSIAFFSSEPYSSM